jgi:gliding motility-associated-like protein
MFIKEGPMKEFKFLIFFLISFSLKAQLSINAGNDQTICLGKSAVLGANPTASSGKPPYLYSWSPSTTLNNPTIANPTASPSVPTTYYLSVTDSTGTKTDSVRINVTYSANVPAYAGRDTTIFEGQNTTLHASGGVHYFWTPSLTLSTPFSVDTDAEPIITTSYYVTVTDIYGCSAVDSVTVFVKPSEQLFFYNTFTPNFDSNNDSWYIGNLHKYPDNQLKIYNRYGKLVFTASPYLNEWDGKSFNEELPADTYFYVLNPGDGSQEYIGSVTIIR